MSEFPKKARLVVGAGALGLFLAYELQAQFPADIHFLLSQSEIPETVCVRSYRWNLPRFFSPHFYVNVPCKELYVYICTPPETCDSILNDLEKSNIAKNVQEKIFFIFLNNGLLAPETVLNFGKKMESYDHILCTMVRCIVVAGFKRDQDKKGTTNTCGNKIYYSSLFKNFSYFWHDVFPMGGTLDWENDDSILLKEKSKFFVNFMLAIFTGPHLHENARMITNPGVAEIKKAAWHYCNLFSDPLLKAEAVETHFWHTIHATPYNVNSISLAWNQGRHSTILYFASQIEKLALNTKNVEAQVYFIRILLYGFQ